jgi:hypothetical protein
MRSIEIYSSGMKAKVDSKFRDMFPKKLKKGLALGEIPDDQIQKFQAGLFFSHDLGEASAASRLGNCCYGYPVLGRLLYLVRRWSDDHIYLLWADEAASIGLAVLMTPSSGIASANNLNE